MNYQKEYDRLKEKIGENNFELSFFKSDINPSIEYPNALVKHLPTKKEYRGDIFPDRFGNALYCLKQLEKDLS